MRCPVRGEDAAALALQLGSLQLESPSWARPPVQQGTGALSEPPALVLSRPCCPDGCPDPRAQSNESVFLIRGQHPGEHPPFLGTALHQPTVNPDHFLNDRMSGNTTSSTRCPGSREESPRWTLPPSLWRRGAPTLPIRGHPQ